MKQKGRRSAAALEGRTREEITRDERIRIITLYNDAGWNWTKIGRTLEINRRIAITEVLDRLFDSMPARLQAVIDAGGGPIPYWN